MRKFKDLKSKTFNKERFNFTQYMEDVYSQLECNASDDYKSKYIVFTYSEKDIDDNLNYFENSYIDGLSAYTALTLFGCRND